MSALEAKITISAIDRVSNVVKNISKSLDGISKSTSNLSNSWNRLSAASSDVVSRVRNITLVAIAAGTSIFALAEHYASYSKELTLSSIRTGVAVDSLQKLQYAASLSGVSTDSLNTSLKFLNRSIAVGATNPTSQQAAAFNSMGIKVRDANGHLKDANTLLIEISSRFQKSTNAAINTNTAMGLFGKQGTKLIPFLREGPEHIKKFEEEFEKLGHVWSPEDRQLGLGFEESFIKLKTAISGVASVIAIDLFPVLKPIVDYMTDWIVANKLWLADNIKQDVIIFSQALKSVWQNLKNIADSIMPVVNILGGFKNILIILAGLYIARFALSLINLVSAIAGVASAFAVLSWTILASPITWIIGGIALLSFAIYELIKHWSEVKAYMISIGPSVIPYFETFANIITLGMYSVVKSIFTNWSKITPYLEETWASISTNASYYFNEIYNTIAKAFAPIMPYVTSIWDGVKSYLSNVLNDILGFFGTNLDAIESRFSKILSSMKESIMSFVDFISKPFEVLYGLFENVVDKVVSIKNAITGGSSVPDGGNATTSVKPLIENNLGLDKQTNPISAGLQAAASNLNSNSIMGNITPTQNSHIDINMIIDYEGRPTKVTAKSPSSINFSASVGKMI